MFSGDLNMEFFSAYFFGSGAAILAVVLIEAWRGSNDSEAD
jgi:hypothetical protein